MSTFTLRPMTLTELSAYYLPTQRHDPTRRRAFRAMLTLSPAADRLRAAGYTLRGPFTLRAVCIIVCQIGWPPAARAGAGDVRPSSGSSAL